MELHLILFGTPSLKIPILNPTVEETMKIISLKLSEQHLNIKLVEIFWELESEPRSPIDEIIQIIHKLIDRTEYINERVQYGLLSFRL
jgi:hypothetical protein